MSRKRPRTGAQKPQNAARQGSRQAPEMGQLRIIGGQWRSRKLSFPAVDGLRPTGDRWRETLFNWLAPVIPGTGDSWRPLPGCLCRLRSAGTRSIIAWRRALHLY